MIVDLEWNDDSVINELISDVWRGPPPKLFIYTFPQFKMEGMQQDNGPKHTDKATKGKNSVMSVTWLQSNWSCVSHAEAESPQNKQEVKMTAVYGS